MFTNLKTTALKKIKKLVLEEQFINLKKNVIELNNSNELKKIFGWNKDFKLERPDIFNFEGIEDVNERRIRDAESIATIVSNSDPKVILEIGTADGMGTVLISSNAPKAKIYTVNILPEEIHEGKGGKYTTIALEREKIGIAYKERKIANITQIYANTANWEPNFKNIDIAFIDGCHDTNFVINDTIKVINKMDSGSFILWHDFNINLMHKYHWIYSVCLGIENLYKMGILHGRIYTIKDSWVGIYQVK